MVVRAYQLYRHAPLSTDVTHVQVLRQESIRFVVAPYEADAQLAYLMQAGTIQGVITEDSDTIPYGCDNVLYKMDKAGNGQLFRRSALGSVPAGKVTPLLPSDMSEEQVRLPPQRSAHPIHPPPFRSCFAGASCVAVTTCPRCRAWGPKLPSSECSTPSAGCAATSPPSSSWGGCATTPCAGGARSTKMAFCALTRPSDTTGCTAPRRGVCAACSRCLSPHGKRTTMQRLLQAMCPRPS